MASKSRMRRSSLGPGKRPEEVGEAHDGEVLEPLQLEESRSPVTPRSARSVRSSRWPRYASARHGATPFDRRLQVAETVLVPPRAHAGLVLRRRSHGGREALVAPLQPPLELPRA